MILSLVISVVVFFLVHLETLYIRRRSQLLRDNRPTEVSDLIYMFTVDRFDI
jgi:hypothetical protein